MRRLVVLGTAVLLCSAAPAAHATTKTVKIEDFEFSPKTLTVAAGTKVTWTNKDKANHTVTFKKGPGDLGNLDEDQHRSATFRKKGTFTYVCTLHFNMRGKIIVR